MAEWMKKDEGILRIIEWYNSQIKLTITFHQGIFSAASKLNDEEEMTFQGDYCQQGHGPTAGELQYFIPISITQ